MAASTSGRIRGRRVTARARDRRFVDCAWKSSADDEVEAKRVGYCIAEMPPLLFVVRESLCLHESDEERAIRRDLAGGVRCVSGFGKRIERRSHVDLGPGSVDEREVDRDAKIMAAAARDVTVAQQILPAGALR